MWSNLTKPLSIAAVTLVLFAALVIGMATLSQNGGGAWGLDNSMSPEEAAENSFEDGDFRLLSIRFMNMGRPGQQITLGANCWPESLNTIDYEVNFAIQREPERGAHTMRTEYASRYNMPMASLLVGEAKECKIRHR